MDGKRAVVLHMGPQEEATQLQELLACACQITPRWQLGVPEAVGVDADREHGFFAGGMEGFGREDGDGVALVVDGDDEIVEETRADEGAACAGSMDLSGIHDSAERDA